MEIEIKKWEAKIIEIALHAYWVRQEANIRNGERLILENEVEEGHRQIEWAKGKQAAIRKILDKIREVN